VEDIDDARDITQQAFINALNNISKYENRGLPFKSWLYRIALNELNQCFRKKTSARYINIEDEHILELRVELEEDPYEGFYARLADSLTKLDHENLSLIEMRFFEKRSFKEISEILGITENNAKVRMYRLLEKMKAMITGKTKTGANL
jgi:RNA polymerase sigma-70 factor (ECF subfamily)